MSVELDEFTTEFGKRLSVTQFWGNDKRGSSLQLTAHYDCYIQFSAKDILRLLPYFKKIIKFEKQRLREAKE